MLKVAYTLSILVVIILAVADIFHLISAAMPTNRPEFLTNIFILFAPIASCFVYIGALVALYNVAVIAMIKSHMHKKMLLLITLLIVAFELAMILLPLYLYV